MTMEEVLEHVIARTITPTLKEAGFKKSGRNFYRSMGDVGWCFQLETSRANTENEVHFTFDVGIFVPEAAILLTGIAVPKFPKAYDCLLKKRVSELRGLQGEHWYELTLESDERMLEATLKEHIQKNVLPFFEAYPSVESVLSDVREHLSAIDYAVLLYAGGRREESAALLSQTYERSTLAKRERIREIAQRMGVDL